MTPYTYKEPSRENWYSGPWDDEPDMLEWQAHGLECCLLRNGSGAWCGYVGVRQSHPVPQGLVYQDTLNCHGGITWAKSSKINDLFWLGFDCAHSGDRMPSRPMQIFLPEEMYCNFYYAKLETEALAYQLATVLPNIPDHNFTLSAEGYTKLMTLLTNEMFPDANAVKKLLLDHLAPQ